jgi:hypothetical protein
VTSEELVADRKAVVKAVNKIRKAHGLGSTSRMTRGVPLHIRACTLAMTLQGTGITTVGYEEDGTILLCGVDGVKCLDDPVMARFLHNFDTGLYPELEIPKSEVKIKGAVVA